MDDFDLWEMELGPRVAQRMDNENSPDEQRRRHTTYLRLLLGGFCLL